MSDTPNPFVAFVERYGIPAGEHGPELLVREVFGVEPDTWQRDVLRAFARGERRISVRSCHGVGKTALLSWLVWVMLLTRFPQKTVATAPSVAQLEDALVAEVLKWYERLPPMLKSVYEVKKNRIEHRGAPKESFFSARTAREENPEALQGVHSEHVLLIADEASGVPGVIFEAASGSMSGHSATTVLAGNPVRTSGLFFDSQTRLAHQWVTLHVGHTDSARVSAEFVREIAETYGEDSNVYRVRVLGEFPKSDADTIIPYELIAAAQQRDIEVDENAPEVWGLDTARYGDDQNVLVRRNRLALLPRIESWQGRDTMYTTGRVKRAWDETEPSRRPEAILIDSIGLGGGVADRLRELGLPARDVNVSETDDVHEQYRNLRTGLWFRAKDWLASRRVRLPQRCECERCGSAKNGRGTHVDQLVAELSAQRFGYTSSGRIMAAPKSETKKLLRRSPDVADAFCLTFASEIAVLAHGGSQSRYGTGPLSRLADVV